MIVAGLSKRLVLAADMVRQGAVFADVGTDHAYLPLFLLKAGKIVRAVCSDVNKGPLESAIQNAKDMGFYDNIEFVLTDGAEALSGRGVCDLAICGMGGELIADIVSRAAFLRDKEINLILQPMSKQAHLRRELSKMGFEIKDERYTKEGTHAYVVMLVSYSGVTREISEVDAELGMLPMAKIEEAERFYLEKRLASIKKAELGKLHSGAFAGEEAELINAITKLLDK